MSRVLVPSSRTALPLLFLLLCFFDLSKAFAPSAARLNVKTYKHQHQHQHQQQHQQQQQQQQHHGRRLAPFPPLISSTYQIHNGIEAHNQEFFPVSFSGEGNIERTKRQTKSWWRNALHQLKQRSARFLLPLAFATALFFSSSSVSPASAVTGGRVGGSFGRSSSSSYSRSSYSSRSYSSSSPSIVIRGGPSRLYYSNSPSYGHYDDRFTLSDALIVGSVIAFIGYQQYKNSSEDGPSTVMTLTVSMNVPDRKNPNSILRQIQQISEGTDTFSRYGVGMLLSNVCLQLARQEDSIVSAKVSQATFNQDDKAERQFNQISLQERTKFEQEAFNKYGSEVDMRYQVDTSDDDNNDDGVVGKSTLAIVTVTASVTGSLPSGFPRKIVTRQDVRNALTSISSAVTGRDSLMAGEILWAPQGPSSLLTEQEVYSRYPDLIPV